MTTKRNAIQVWLDKNEVSKTELAKVMGVTVSHAINAINGKHWLGPDAMQSLVDYTGMDPGLVLKHFAKVQREQKKLKEQEKANQKAKRKGRKKKAS